ncbi:hypothetical protein LMG28727_03529 [Paraburkholderia kirstenboschensis]|nr:hypothetical protein LMG28727_03529 [Paraburkholderia kirstenboschensis]
MTSMIGMILLNVALLGETRGARQHACRHAPINQAASVRMNLHRRTPRQAHAARASCVPSISGTPVSLSSASKSMSEKISRTTRPWSVTSIMARSV